MIHIRHNVYGSEALNFLIKYCLTLVEHIDNKEYLISMVEHTSYYLNSKDSNSVIGIPNW